MTYTCLNALLYNSVLNLITFDVIVSVRAKTRPGEVVYLVGNSEELGRWNPQQAVQMRRETKQQTSLEDIHDSCFEECSENG